MVFKKPGNSRDDKSNKSSGRRAASGDNPRTSSSPRTRNASSKFAKPDSGAPKRRSTGEGAGDDAKKPFAQFRKKTSSGGFEPSGDRPTRSFGSGDREDKAYSSRSRRPTEGAGDRGKRSFGNSASGEKKTFAPRDRKPFEGGSSDERPKRSFGNGPSSDKKSFSPRGKAASSRAESADGEKRFSKPTGAGRSADFKSDTFKKHPARTEGGENTRPSRDEYAGPGEYNAPRTAPKGGSRPASKGKKSTADDSHLIRLNRYISNAGICSRRKADELIAAGVVSVNGEVVSELGHKVDPSKDVIRYNGETLKREKNVYVLLNKPKDYITTTDDPQERRTVMQLVEKASKERIYPIGRLDRSTTGLLLMTNDGDLADKLSHPRSGVTKIYQVELNKSLTQGDMNKIEYGLELEDGLIKPDMVSYVAGGSKKEIGIQIHSGKNRIVRRIFENLGYEVVKLDRTIYANLTKKDLPRGRWRYLEEQEIIQLKHLIK
jgi:23S rRNA pseudouridine2605 synthase